jgi:hypothetical protein
MAPSGILLRTAMVFCPGYLAEASKTYIRCYETKNVTPVVYVTVCFVFYAGLQKRESCRRKPIKS